MFIFPAFILEEQLPKDQWLTGDKINATHTGDLGFLFFFIFFRIHPGVEGEVRIGNSFTSEKQDWR